MILQILSHTPIYVWVLLAALLALGFSQTWDRQVAPPRLLLLPLVLLGLGLWSMAPNFVAMPLAALAWGLALAGCVALRAGRPVRAGTRWLPEQQRLHLPGSWLPLLMIVAIFVLRYTSTVALVLNPQWRGAPEVLLPLALVYGSLSGLFLGRALALLKLTRSPAPVVSHA